MSAGVALVSPAIDSVTFPPPFGRVSVTVGAVGTPVTGSLKVITNLSPASIFPFPAEPVLWSDWILAITGAAPSDGAVAENEPCRPDVSTIPLDESIAIVNVPTAVFAAVPPSAIVNVAVVPEVVTELSVPPEGTLLSVQPAVHGAAHDPSVLSNVATTWSTFPLLFVSFIVIETSDGPAPTIVDGIAEEQTLVTASLLLSPS